jgi:AcrR family transcriptional regulator
MVRHIPEDRFDHLIDTATKVFIDQGFQRTQMADVADEMGLAKGTLYLYVESKEALFDLVVRHADGPRPIPLPSVLPVPTPARGSTLRFVQKSLAERSDLPLLRAALERTRVHDAPHELDGILRELYRVVHRNRLGLKLVDRCAADYPELAAIWFESGRRGLTGLLAAYLDDRIRRRALRAVPDVAISARLLLETIVFWAVHRFWDPAPHAVDESRVEDTVVSLLVEGLRRAERKGEP